MLFGKVGVLVELGLKPLDFLETLDEDGLGGITFQICHGGGCALESLGLHEGVELLHGGLQLLDHHGSLLHEPDFSCLLAGLLPAKEGDGGIHGILLLAKVEDVAVGLGAIEHAVGAGESLNQAVVPQVLVHVEGIQELGVEAGEQHVHDDGDVDLVGVGEICVGPLLVFDALLHILIIEVELAEAVIGSVAGIVIREDGFQRGFLPLGVHLVVRLLLRQIFLDLLHIGIPLGGWGKDAGDIQRLKVGISCLLLLFTLGLHGLEQSMVFDGVVDGGGSQEGIEAASTSGGVVLGEDGLDDGFLR